jgi:hypothetical protein
VHVFVVSRSGFHIISIRNCHFLNNNPLHSKYFIDSFHRHPLIA